MKALVKKIVVWFLVLSIAVLSFSACKNDESNHKPQFDFPSSKTEVELYNATDFSENKSVVLFKNTDGENYCNAGVLNTDGEISVLKDIFITILPEKDDKDLIATPSNWSTFTDGYAFIDYTDKASDLSTTYERFVIFDTDGNITAISPLDADYTILCGGDGLYLVKQETKSTMTAYGTANIGVINYNGEWVCPLSDPSNYYSTNIKLWEADCEYLGEHVFSFTYNRYDDELSYAGCWLDLFNVDTNTYVEYPDVKMLSGFSDGKALLYKTSPLLDDNYMSGTEIYSIDHINFQLQHLFSNVAWNGWGSQDGLDLASCPIVSEGLIFGIECRDLSQTYSAYDIPKSVFVSKFFDMNGNSIIDVTRYRFTGAFDWRETDTGFYQFINGNAVIEIAGNDGRYITTINTAGESLYEPVKATGINFDVETNLIAVKVEQNVNGETCNRNAFINATTGEITVKDFEVTAVKDYREMKWHSGYIRDCNYFIDMDGNRLLTYI